MNLKVVRIIDETHDTKTLVLVDSDEGGRPWDYRAGQYLTFRFDNISDRPVVRSYTLSSSPCELEYCAFTVKRVSGGVVSNWLCDHVRVGDVLRARGPIGHFCYDPEHDKKHLVMVAAGSGVTPFVSIMRECIHLRSRQEGLRMSLIVSFRSGSDIICRKDLDRFKSFGCDVWITLTRSFEEQYLHQRIDDELLERLITWPMSDATYMTCGPESMMQKVCRFLLSRHVPAIQIKTESFSSQ